MFPFFVDLIFCSFSARTWHILHWFWLYALDQEKQSFCIKLLIQKKVHECNIYVQNWRCAIRGDIRLLCRIRAHTRFAYYTVSSDAHESDIELPNSTKCRNPEQIAKSRIREIPNSPNYEITNSPTSEIPHSPNLELPKFWGQHKRTPTTCQFLS